MKPSYTLPDERGIFCNMLHEEKTKGQDKTCVMSTLKDLCIKKMCPEGTGSYNKPTRSPPETKPSSGCEESDMYIFGAWRER